MALTPSRPGLDLNLTGLHPEHPSSSHLALDTGPPSAALHRPLVDEAPTLPSGAITVLCVSDSSPVLPGTRQRPPVLFLCFQPQNWPRSLPAEDASPTRLKTEAAWGAPGHQCLGERSPPSLQVELLHPRHPHRLHASHKHSRLPGKTGGTGLSSTLSSFWVGASHTPFLRHQIPRRGSPHSESPRSSPLTHEGRLLPATAELPATSGFSPQAAAPLTSLCGADCTLDTQPTARDFPRPLLTHLTIRLLIVRRLSRRMRIVLFIKQLKWKTFGYSTLPVFHPSH